MTVVVPRADRRVGVAGGDYAEFGKWRSADETLVGIYLVGRGMVDGEKTDLVEINGFFHGLHETETEQAIQWMNAAGVDLEIFVGIRDIALAGGHPMADDAGANHVGDEFVFAAIPGEEDRARASAAVELSERMKFFRGQIYFVLGNAGGPKQTHDFDIFFGAESGEDGCGILAKVTGSAGDFPFLIERARVNFHFCANGGFVVAERFQID